MIPLAEPNLSGKEKEYVSDAISSGWVSGGGPYVERFEEMVAKASGKKWAVATTTGTAALHVAMVALRFTDTVVVPKNTFVAARNVVEMIGCDVGRSKGDINHDSAIIYQWDRDWPKLNDAAPAIGTTLPIATLHTFSFNGNKTITTGQGGAVVGDDVDLENIIRGLIVPKDGGRFNYRMANVNASIGCAQMERLDEFLKKKLSIWSRYRIEGIKTRHLGNSHWMSAVKVDNAVRASAELRDLGIDARPLWHLTDILCLPCSTNLTIEDQDKVIKCVSSL